MSLAPADLRKEGPAFDLPLSQGISAIRRELSNPENPSTMDQIQRTNAALRAARKRTRIEPTSGGGCLRIRYSQGGKLHRISPGTPNTPEGLKEIERIAVLVDAQLALGKLDPSEWSPREQRRNILTNKKVIARVRLWYFRNRNEDEAAIFGFKNDYLAILKKLDPDAEFNREEVMALVQSYRPQSRQRARAGNALSRAAKEAGAIDLSREVREASRGGERPQTIDQRRIPNDLEIEAFIDGLEDEGWRWCLGVICCWGLRPHEAYHSTPMDDPRLLKVGAQTKTGARIALARKPQWIDRWNLSRKRLPLELMRQGRPNTVIGGVICHFMRKQKAGWSAYSARHRYALAMIQKGIKVDIVSRSMGHTIQQHYSCYQRFISEQELGQIARSF